MKKCCSKPAYILDDLLPSVTELYCLTCKKSQTVMTSDDWILAFDMNPLLSKYIADCEFVNSLPHEIQLFLKLNDTK